MDHQSPKETIFLPGCDFEHWLVFMDKPQDDNATRNEIIDHYIKTLAKVIGSEEEARMKIYSVSTKCYFAFGALVSEELSTKLQELPGVYWVLPDSYIDVRNKNYGGEPFIDGQAVPYDPKYHEEWVRNNQQAGDRNRRTRTEKSKNYPPNQRQMPPWNNSGQMPPQNNPAPVPPQHRPGLMPPPNNPGPNPGWSAIMPRSMPDYQNTDPNTPYQGGQGPNVQYQGGPPNPQNQNLNQSRGY